MSESRRRARAKNARQWRPPGSPSTPSLFRTTAEEYVLGRGTPRAKTIPKGSVVALLRGSDDRPRLHRRRADFRPGRLWSNYVRLREVSPMSPGMAGRFYPGSYVVGFAAT